MADPGGRPPGTEPDNSYFLKFRGKEGGLIFKGLEKPLSAEIQGT